MRFTKSNIRLVVLNDQKNYTMTRARLLVSIALSYAAAKGSAYETQDTSFTFDVSDFGLTPELSEGLGGDDAAASADTCFDGRCRDSPTYMSIMSLPATNIPSLTAPCSSIIFGLEDQEIPKASLILVEKKTHEE